MSFIKNNTGDRIDPAVVNANFLWVGYNSLLPKGGANLDFTTGVNDLGSSEFRWENSHFTTLDANNIKNAPCLMGSFTVDVDNTETATIEFSGLNSDQDGGYLIRFSNIPITSGIILVSINNDSNTANYNSTIPPDFPDSYSGLKIITSYASYASDAIANLKQTVDNTWNINSYAFNTGLFTTSAGAYIVFGTYDQDVTITTLTFSIYNVSIVNFNTYTSIEIYKVR